MGFVIAGTFYYRINYKGFVIDGVVILRFQCNKMLPDVTHFTLILLNLGLSGLLKAHGNPRPISVSMYVSTTNQRLQSKTS